MAQVINDVDRQFVVDKRLGAVPVSQLLNVRSQLRFEGRIERPVVAGEDRAVLQGGQDLLPSVLYPAQHDASLRYYLPTYQVLADGQGQPAVRLEYDATAANGNAGSLALSLTWTPPNAGAGMQLRIIDHVAALSLRYRVPVEAEVTTAGIGTSGIENVVELQPLQAAGSLLMRSVTMIATKEQFAAIYQALRTPNQGATLELKIRARVGMQTWRQVIVGRPAQADQIKVLQRNDVLFTQMVQANGVELMQRAPDGNGARLKMMVAAGPRLEAAPSAMQVQMLRAPGPSATRLAINPATQRVAMPVARPVSPRMPIAQVRPMVTPVRVTDQSLAQVNRPPMIRAVAESDMEISGRKVVPVRVALDRRQRPAVIDADMENAQLLQFCFEPTVPANVGVYVGPATGHAIHLLQRITLTKDGRPYYVFQDNLMPDVIHLPPSAFRLLRDNDAPYLPQMSFLASEFSTSENEQDVDVLYRVAVVYRLEPWLDPEVIQLVRDELAKRNLVPRFTTSIPPGAKLTLDLDLLGDKRVRDGARIDETGITDTLDLDQASFERLWRERLSAPASGGVGGQVEYPMFDGSQARVPVQLSLWEVSADLVNVALIGTAPDLPNRYLVRIANRVESPIEITELPGELLAEGVVARPVNPAAVLGKVLQPREALQVAYDAGASAPAVADFDPTVFGRTTASRLDAILKLLMVTTGYASLGFAVDVKAIAGAFAPPTDGGEALTGLLVEFDDGSRATLTPDDADAQVNLLGRLIDRLLGTADDRQRYFYRVTNLHASGEGARTSWTEGLGSGVLEVGSARVQLAF